MAQTTEGATQSVDSVQFSFMTKEEVLKHSFVKITSPDLINNHGVRIPGGLYDPALGPLEDIENCKTCAESRLNCPGHCGHIDLVFTAYNPLMFNYLYTILQRTCFSCYHFMANRNLVRKCVSQLKLIAKGDVVGARGFELGDSEEEEEFREGTPTSCTTDMDQEDCVHSKQKKWTSLQLTEAMSILDNILKPKYSKCQNCKAKSPQIRKPTFGWLQWDGMTSGIARENVIRECMAAYASEDSMLINDEDVSDVENNNLRAGHHGGEDSVSKGRKRKNAQVPAEFGAQQKKYQEPLLPPEVEHCLKRLWENEFEICSFISDIQQQGFGNKGGHSIFFLERILVPPIKFRAPTKGGDYVMEHPQTVLLSKVVKYNISLLNAYTSGSSQQQTRVAPWMDLQQSINVLFDSKTASGSGQKVVVTGIRQLLEKKEGMVRQKMMGKRVNFSGRSVISPDPYLAVNEIGIPPCFALRLTYPERVTPWNMLKLREAIKNGPEIHPGATHYIDKLSTKVLPPIKRERDTVSRKLPSSRGAIMEHRENSGFEFEGKTVLRHLQDGDVVLVNRQPTLHKPGIMAHIVRVLKGEKTIRMHYANCSTYNADFDGDEMNVHFPQDEISRSEAYNIVNANNQYFKPSNGDPIRALIQDHIVSAALLTKRDTFLNRDDFNQLLSSSGIYSLGLRSSVKPGQKIIVSSSEEDILPVPPAIWKPEPLWTGKQVITAILNYITSGCPPFSVKKRTKTPRDFFKRRIKKAGDADTKMKELDEDKLLIYKNDLVRGVIDKAQFADYGLVHTVQELYGSNAAGSLLSAFSRLFTVYLQMHGFTCGVDDLLITKDKDDQRKKQLGDCERKVIEAQFNLFGGGIHDKIEKRELQNKIEQTIRCCGETATSTLDRKVTKVLNESSSGGVLSELLSEGLSKSTGKNCISLMTTSGAKGSKVNFQQISAYLGQQELEGKRVPRMVSGKTLPCFHPWDWQARAGGFISDRFLTGLRPQEYYFHCMAGREGLVDTAVKTSRSGYLQRCLIKNLESLKISYDYTVRDADSSIVQFQYGEDGVDVHQTSFITNLEALALNQDMISQKYTHQLSEPNNYITDLPKSLQRKAIEFVDGFSSKGKSCAKPMKQEHFIKLLKHKFFSILAPPGEAVGMLASHSVGEPSTQMTLNTFHLAGRGESNVTLGIPRLQEILMTASANIKTPLMTCPLLEGKTKEDAMRVADKMKKITVEDIVEDAEVSVSYADFDCKIFRVYKLEMKLCKTEQYPKYADVTVQDWKDVLNGAFRRELEDAIQSHIKLLSKISGINSVLQPLTVQVEENVDDDADIGDDDDDDGAGDDLGLDATKQKLQVNDEIDYDDEESEEEHNEGEVAAGSESENEHVIVEDDAAGFNDDRNEIFENPTQPAIILKSKSEEKRRKRKRTSFSVTASLDDSTNGICENPTQPANMLKSKSKEKKRTSFIVKKYDRAIEWNVKECDCRQVHQLHFEAQFKFDNEPHILLAEIAKKASKKVYIQSSGKVDQCRVTDCSENQVIYYGKDDPKQRKVIELDEKKKIPALHASGVNFHAFWEMQDELDVRYLYCNNIHAILNTYGVDAARDAIIKEISTVFGSYGISVNMRHLTLIADFMTHSGRYRPMSRLGGIADSISPFSKMSFETASKVIVEAAKSGQTDYLETPSARICLGLPVKMGTGSFDVMQKVELRDN